MERSISSLGLLFTSVSAIIGSGWLFSAHYTAQLAGPASLTAWLLGGIFIIIVAFVFAELCAMLPVSGSSSRIPQFTHGSLVSFVFAWMIWLSYLACLGTEVQAVIQYSSFYFPDLTYANGQLTTYGFSAAVVLMLIASVINTYSLRWLIRCNNLLTIMKLAVPLILVLFVLVSYFSVDRAIHPVNTEFSPFGIHGVFAAISMGGVMFAFNGFKQAAEMAGEAKNPKFAVPFAIVGSIGICLMLYLLLQTAFLSSLAPYNLTQGWQSIQLNHNTSPFASIMLQDNLGHLLPLLYIGAIIAPFAAGLMYCGSAARSLFAMSQNGYIPAIFQNLSNYGNPLYAILANFAFGLLLFAPLPGWDKMVNFLSSLLAVTYSIGPITLLTLRYQAPDYPRPLKLPFGNLWAYCAFYICTLLAYWSGWNTISKMGIALILGLCVFAVFRRMNAQDRNNQLDFYSSLWMWPYLGGLILISYVGNYGGGLGLLSAPVMLVIIAAFCIAIMKLATVFRLPAAKTQRYLKSLHREPIEAVEELPLETETA